MDLKKELVLEIEVVDTKNHSDEVTINSLEGLICLVYYRVTLGTGLRPPIFHPKKIEGPPISPPPPSPT